MKKIFCAVFLGVLLSGSVQAANKNEPPAVGTKAPSSTPPSKDPCAVKAKAAVNGVRELDWLELMPKAECDALVNMPVDHGGGPDTPLTLEDQMVNALDEANKQKKQPAAKQAAIIPELNNIMVKIPGFIVPVELSKDGKILEFLLVPYFGACIHVPPPPPNQVIYVKVNKALEPEIMYEPVWAMGLLKTEKKESELATAMYSMGALKVEVYKEPATN